MSAALGAARRTATIPKSYAHTARTPSCSSGNRVRGRRARWSERTEDAKTVQAGCVLVIQVVRRPQPRVRTLLSPKTRSSHPRSVRYSRRGFRFPAGAIQITTTI